ncbi:MAG: hypothetical protein AAF612_11945 [Planctomycetota bacterium]
MRSVATVLGFVGLALALAASWGCGRTLTNPLLAPPEAEVVAVTPVERTPEADRVLVTLRITNSEGVELPLREAAYTVRGPDGASRSTRAQVFATAPAEGEQWVRLPISVARDEALAMDPDPVYRVSGSITYEPPGEFRRILTDSAVPLPAVLFAGTGREGDDAGLLDAIDVLGVFDEAEGDAAAPGEAPETAPAN